MAKRKILVISSETSVSMAMRIDESAKRAVSKDAEIIVVSLTRGPRLMEGPVDEAFSVPGMLEVAKRFEGRFHGIISACFGDPGLEVLRVALGVPVVGIRESSFLLASWIGDHFSVIVPMEGVDRKLRNFARQKGIEDKLLSVEFAGITVSDLEVGSSKVMDFLYKAGQKGIEKGADCLIFGCAGMGKIVNRLSSRFEVPCIDPVQSAVKLMEGILYFRQGRGFKGVSSKNEIVDYPDHFW